MKKKLLALSALSLSMFMTGCDSTNNDNKEYETLSFETMYDYSAISGINLLNMNHMSGLQMKKTLTDTEKTEILDNLHVVENMISGDIVKSEEVTSTKEGYEKMYTLTTTNFDGSHDIYTFYYNETIMNEIDDDDDDRDRENEQEMRMEGLVVMNDVEYQMFGQKEIENNEFEVEFKIKLDESNYVVIEQEMENNEIEFEYTQYQNNKKVYETSIEFEKKRNENMEIEFEEKTSTSKKEYRYKFIKEGSKQFVEVKINENNDITQAKIQVLVDENNQVQYVFVENNG